MTTLWRDLDEIVDLRPLADDGIAVAAAVDGRVGADLDIVLDDHPPDLRHLQVPLGAGHEAETILSDANAGMDDDPVADQRMGDRDTGGEIDASRPIRTPGPITVAGADHGPRPISAPAPDHGAGLDRDALLEPRRR